jgi:hypothetical protein
MSEQDAVALMKSSRSEAEWKQNADKVWRAYGEYPHFWYAAIIQSGVAETTKASFAQERSAHE